MIKSGADLNTCSRRRVVSIEELGLKWLRIWSDTSMVMVVVGATSMLLIRDP
jgi:hypothetical protein